MNISRHQCAVSKNSWGTHADTLTALPTLTKLTRAFFLLMGRSIIALAPSTFRPAHSSYIRITFVTRITANNICYSVIVLCPCFVPIFCILMSFLPLKDGSASVSLLSNIWYFRKGITISKHRPASAEGSAQNWTSRSVSKRTRRTHDCTEHLYQFKVSFSALPVEKAIQDIKTGFRISKRIWDLKRG